MSHWHCLICLAQLVSSNSSVATASMAAGSECLTTFTALPARAFGTCTSWSFLHKIGLCRHGCIFLGISYHERGSEYVYPALVGDYVHCFCLEW